LDVEPTTYVMSKGVALEPVLREKFSAWYASEFLTIDPFEARSLVHPEYDFMRANMDGITQCGSVLIECKYMSRAKLGSIPPHYFCQVQHQLFVSRAKKAYLVAANERDASDMRIVEIPRDEAFINSHLILCEQFWANVQMRKAPPSSVQVIEDPNALLLASRYKVLQRTLEELEKEKEEIRKSLLQYATKDETRIQDITIKKVVTKGSLDTEKLSEVVNIEEYRKEAKTSYRITLEENNKNDNI